MASISGARQLEPARAPKVNPAAFKKLRRVGAKSGSPFSSGWTGWPGESRSTTLIQYRFGVSDM
jgi:hypothetical protein